MRSIIQLDNHPVIKFACEELSAASERAGTRWLVKEGVDRLNDGAVMIGTWDALKKRGWLPSEMNRRGDSYFIGEVDGNIWVSGENERATLYAVYDFCKSYWGSSGFIHPNLH